MLIALSVVVVVYGIPLGGVPGVNLISCGASGSSSSSSGGNGTCNGFTGSAAAACSSCVESSCSSEIQAASQPCSAYVSCVCAAGGSASSCASQLSSGSCQTAANAVQACATSNCASTCGGFDAGGGNGCPMPQAPPQCASNGDCTNGMQCNTATCSCSCPGNTTLCNTCTDTSSDSNNCGGCGNACANGETCQAGQCACPDGSLLGTNVSCPACGVVCLAGQVCGPPGTPNTPAACHCLDNQQLNSDSDCGQCGNDCTVVHETCGPGGSCTCGAGNNNCPTGQTCTNGPPGNPSACCPAAAPLNCGQGRCATCCADTDCTGAGQQCCGGTCVVTKGSDNTNCGACQQVCSTTCQQGVCNKPKCPTTAIACPSFPTCCDAATQTCVGNTCVALGCAAGCSAIGPSGACCGGGCVDTNSDPNNCGVCGLVCASNGSCVNGSCSTVLPPQSCLPGNALTLLVTGANVVAYIPNGAWETASTGVLVVPVEGNAFAPLTIPTAQIVNSCQGDSALGVVVCIGNNIVTHGNDVYVISGATNTITNTLTSAATTTESFTGGSCDTCAEAIDPVHLTGYISIGTATGASYQPMNLQTNTLGTPISSGVGNTAENLVYDPTRGLVLSPTEANNYQLLNTATGKVYNFIPGGIGAGGEFDSAAEDCTTGIAISTVEFTSQIFITDLSQAVFGATTWSAPFAAPSISEFGGFSAGTCGIAIAPNSHLGIVTGEFGGNAIGAIQLPATAGSGTPALVDWVADAIPNLPGGGAWANGLDPHTLTAYTSPATNKQYAVLSNGSNTFMAVIDLQAFLALPRSVEGHQLAAPLAVGPVVRFIAL